MDTGQRRVRLVNAKAKSDTPKYSDKSVINIRTMSTCFLHFCTWFSTTWFLVRKENLSQFDGLITFERVDGFWKFFHYWTGGFFGNNGHYTSFITDSRDLHGGMFPYSPQILSKNRVTINHPA